MSASKKSTAKSSKSPAPAKKSAASPAASKTVSRTATVQKRTATPVAMLAPSRGPVARVAPKAVEVRPVTTTIAARVDVGFGNALYLRGEGAGLSWEKGLLMDCIERDLWSITLKESARSYTFKFLINDATWSAGPDFTAACGTSVTLTPEF